MITGNRGEWSEIYALFKLLGDKKLFTGDANLKKIEEAFFPIIKIIRKESGGNFEYLIEGDLIVISGGQEELRVSVAKFSEQAASLLSEIKSSQGASFSIFEIEAFMASVHCTSLKAKSSLKTDILIVVHDKRLNQIAQLGFSIKSHLGGDSTLLNAARTTNFIYQIANFLPTKELVHSINSIGTKSKIKDRIKEISRAGGELEFVAPEKDIFKNNLVLIDSFLPNILAEILKIFFTTEASAVRDLCNQIAITNPINYDTQDNHKFYEYKIKRFLTDVALGMMPGKVWEGAYDATGGYLIVKENGEVVCYHIYNRNQFEEYLFENTKLETASSNRHGFGVIYEQNGHCYFKLNLQIRFK
ncbi:MAG: restriction endonuclease [Methylotenera sp. RIFCSPLOWO2_02_FULL_45_14]|nr:MAG: restriction endonuclease [Methylotenera sp. RIFCSPLOWO2_02_FULL_45_14]